MRGLCMRGIPTPTRLAFKKRFKIWMLTELLASDIHADGVAHHEVSIKKKVHQAVKAREKSEENKMSISTRTLSLLTGALVVSVLLQVPRSASAVDVYTDPVGFYKVGIAVGVSMIANSPMQRLPEYRGVVTGVTSNMISVSGSPWGVGQLAQTNLYGKTFRQYMVIVRRDSDTNSPFVGDCEGDWWTIVSNDVNALTLYTGAEDLTGTLGTNDQIEIRHLTTVADLFGTGASCMLNKDTNKFPFASQEDLIRPLDGASFTAPIYYHDGSKTNEGYYIGNVGVGPFTGNEITFDPDAGFAFFRKTDTPATNVVSLGAVQTRRMTHYFDPGPNLFGLPFPCSAPITNSHLLNSGWLVDTNGFPFTTQEDLIRRVEGVSYTAPIYYSTKNGTNSWLCGNINTPTNGFAFLPTVGYMFLIKGPDALRWRQEVPFTISP